VAPTNRPWANPTALKRAIETGGLSLVRGLRNFARDLLTNGGRPRQVDASRFRLGENLAATPGKVVFRNELMELIQYAPRTRTVHEVPVLFSPPWINKYYILDLAPGRSLIEWTVEGGHTAFALSYRNPDASMWDVGLEDYLISGPRTAFDVIEEITGASQVNVVGLCLGGTLTAMLVAHLAAVGDPRVRSITLLNSLLDFSDPGPVGVFCDRESVEALERRMKARGYLDATEMADTFNVLRANELIWSYAVSNWLLGEDPPAFDLLAWANDNTRMPARMHSFYLRSCYLENRLARGKLELAGRRLLLSRVTQDAYVLGAREDHIVPWRSAYWSAQLLKGDVRFVLASSGHVASIVKPLGSRAQYWTSPSRPRDPDAWLRSATVHEGTWWEDWARWLVARSGARRRPPPLGSRAHPPVDDAPGQYVRQR
jgi:polyhydroxyalkanoate synthase